MPCLLAGRYVRLEPLALDHAAGLVAAATEDRSSYGFTWVPATYDEAVAYIDTALAEQATGTSMPFATVRVADGRVVGSTRFLNLRSWGRPGSSGDPDVAEVGATWLAASVQRSAGQHRGEAPAAHPRLRRSGASNGWS